MVYVVILCVVGTLLLIAAKFAILICYFERYGRRRYINLDHPVVVPVFPAGRPPS